MSIELVMPSNHLILWCPLLLPPSIFPSIRVFSNESALHISWSKYWNSSFSISTFNEYSGLISFRMDWLDLLAVQWALKSLLQHHSLKASVLSAQPSLHSSAHIYTWPLEKQQLWLDKSFAFFSKVKFLVFKILSRFVLAFLPRSKCLLISWQESPSAVIFEPKKIKSVTVSIVSPSICHEVMELDAMILVF